MTKRVTLHADFNKKSIYVRMDEDAKCEQMTMLIERVLVSICQTLDVSIEEIDSVYDYRLNYLLRE